MGKTKHPLINAICQMTEKFSRFVDAAENRSENDIKIQSKVRPRIKKSKNRRSGNKFPTDTTNQHDNPLFNDDENDHRLNQTFSLEITKRFIDSTTTLALSANKIGLNSNDYRIGDLVCIATRQHVEAAIALVRRYMVTASNHNCSLCVHQLTICITDIERSLERILFVCSKLCPDRQRLEELIIPASKSQEVLNTLRADMKTWKKRKSGDYDDTNRMHSRNNDRYSVLIEEPVDMSHSAKILGEATAEVLKAIKIIIQECPNWEGRDLLITAAKGLSDATLGMVNYAQLNVWYSELRHKLSFIQNIHERLPNESVLEFFNDLQVLAKEGANLSITSLRLAKHVNSIRKSLISGTLVNECLSLIHSAEKLVLNIKNAKTQPLTSKSYYSALKTSEKYIKDAKWVLDSFRNVITSAVTGRS